MNDRRVRPHSRPIARRSTIATLPAGALACLVVVACSSSSAPSSSNLPSVLEGTYNAVTPGALAQITFYLGNKYMSVDGACANALLSSDDSAGGSADPSQGSTCFELGTYSLDADTLTLAPAAGGTPHVLPFHADLVATVGDVRPNALRGGEGLDLLGTSLGGGGEAGVALGGGGDAGTQLTSGDAGVKLTSCVASLTKPVGPLVNSFTAGGQTMTGGSAPSGTPDPTQGGTWSCTGSFNHVASTAYYLTSFGCSGSNPAFGDPEDNCCGPGATVAAAQGLCGSLTPASNCSNSCANNQSCNSWRAQQTGSVAASFQCEEMVNYYTTGGVNYGLGARLCLTTAAGKGVVVFVYDNGPSCSIERRVSAHVLDSSPPTTQYLFGESLVGATERKAVFVTQVSASTPLGPNDQCATGGMPSSTPSSGPACMLADGQQGVCMDAQTCTSQHGTATPGLCAGASNIQCCAGAYTSMNLPPPNEAGVDGSTARTSDAAVGSDGGTTPPTCPSATTVSCKVDSDCNPTTPLGNACVNGTCVPGCHAAAQCPSNQTCAGGASGLGACQGTTGGTHCTNDGACNPGGNGAGMICSSGGTCVAGCRASWQCPGSTSCKSGQCK